ncbi:MAG: translocation/assembly module TamB domain-containing protein [Gammaproteobacteria bacterium]|nr:translocation/assembly module TamB domain-containing protein [Gammaproteobacteria bacterium]
MRLARTLAWAVLALLVALAAFAAFVVGTGPGLRLALAMAGGFAPGELEVGNAAGRLAGGMELGDLRWRSGDTRVVVGRLRIQWRPLEQLAALAGGPVRLDALLVEDLRVELPVAAKGEAAMRLPDFPEGLRVERGILRRAEFVNAGVERIGEAEFVLGGDPDGPRLEGSWRELVAGAVSSPQGRFSLGGRADAWQLEASGQLTGEDIPPLEFKTGGRGDRDAFVIGSLTAAGLGGQAEGNGRLAWYPALAWQFDVHASELDPGLQWRDWAGRLGGGFELKSAGAGFIATVRELQGKLRGYPVRGSGTLHWQPDGLELRSVRLESGGARIEANGRMAEQAKLEWSLAADELAALLPGATGRLQASGSLSGRLAAPRVRASLSGNDLRYGDAAADTVTGEVDIDLGGAQALVVDLRATGAAYAGSRYPQLALTGNGTTGAHRLDVILSSEQGEVATLALHGGYREDHGWSGQLDQATLRGGSFGTWALAQAGPLQLSSGEMVAGPWCFHPVEGDGRVCGSARSAASTWNAELDTQRFPLAPLALWLPPGTRVEGLVDGKGRFAGGADGTVTGEAAFATTAGALVSELAGSPQRLAFLPGRISATVNADGARATLELPVENSGRVAASVELPGWRPGTDPAAQRVTGRLDLALESLTVIGELVPEVADLTGGIQASGSLGGTLAVPLFDGGARIAGASATVPGLGLKLSEVNVGLDQAADGNLSIQASARSGEGVLSVTGTTRLDAGAGWPTELRISGEGVQVMNTPQASVLVSPQLELRLRGNEVRLRGEVAIPRAGILLGNALTNGVSASRDVVIVDAESGEVQAEERWQVSSELHVTLGKQVRFEGFGLRGDLGGELQLVDEPGKLTHASGEINVRNGVYQAYGQDLAVQKGRLLYSDTPVDDPELEVTAVRRTGEVVAGIRASGTLRVPRLELFSSPTMNESETLAWLLLGHPLNTSSGAEGSLLISAASAMGLGHGQSVARSIGSRLGLDEVRLERGANGKLSDTSLVVGRYLSPKLYLRYVTGLAGETGALQLEYELSRRLRIRTESGNEFGADLFYILER